MENKMQEEQYNKNEMTDEELSSALEKLSQLTQFGENKLTFDSAAIKNDREEYLNIISRAEGPSPRRIPCKRVAITKGLGYDGKIQSVQIINPVKRVLQEERARRKSNKRKNK